MTLFPSPKALRAIVLPRLPDRREELVRPTTPIGEILKARLQKNRRRGADKALEQFVEMPVASTLDDLKQDLLSRVEAFNTGQSGPPDYLEVVALVDAISPRSPIPDPNHHLASVAGSWITLYASFGMGHSKGKSHHDNSSLALQTFKAFPDIPIRVSDIVQEIGLESNAYNNVVFFKTTTDGCAGFIVIHGRYECDPDNVKRFRVVFHSAELRGRQGISEADIRRSLTLPDDYALKRDFKPAKLHSDIVYLDDTTRINVGGMGVLYVLERRAEPPISL
jgi:hypothetical protein